MIARELAGVIARPQDQVIRLGDDNQSLGSLAVGHAHLTIVYICIYALQIRPAPPAKG